MTKTVAVLMGGWSTERSVSLFKGKAVASALEEAGYIVTQIDVTRNITKLIEDLTPKPDVVFNNLYGRGGEDGTIQGVLEAMQIPYTHSGVMASAIAMDKPITKRIATSIGIKCAEGRVATKEEVLAEAVLPRPYVVKPLNEGSSVGVKIILEGDNEKPIDESEWCFGDEVLVEKYIEGREIQVAVLDGKAIDVTEIIAPGKFYDFEAKYNSDALKLVTPADIPQSVRDAAMDAAAKIYTEIGCAGLARCDLMFDTKAFEASKSGKDAVYFLEINTLPGLTAESVAALQPIQNGMSFVQLCSHLVETAKCHGLTENQQTVKKEVRSSNETLSKGVAHG